MFRKLSRSPIHWSDPAWVDQYLYLGTIETVLQSTLDGDLVDALSYNVELDHVRLLRFVGAPRNPSRDGEKPLA